ncbi:similar to Saccharomyces cerevisiae YDL043C PRP11 Subunit of the SF3a splicing factor complex, required for spliceosome assembly [Maudiozyma barnettii]|uniref:Similar to Saccharomyces cerevisiae YDL043C PRP11 Subunit of the SF3a splicing factor complex, required for spliceosome assembly n=1 Tax=Maudiozyma barnettii TaxID=61262 RepID=A0A8H2VDD1_9SACH|nr:Prp11p [Kazachstania barnettii]CAB4253203.1 similar to Saccharomyces cerevisiae YDL043C PRP11 Subunit of the SF3a splicing factor complex, required for spliceosome assembly [Kazachstania barnettii]CAD1780261.1 similar to Saccharomyces cerevisiae YDL043C PRP11 Subunit of the SF3a splicing factor complex, required for spliceosome assembly [Kazachstania barnettii]
MDYQNRVGSKKGGGGIASDSQANLARRKKVDELLRQGVEVPFTFDEDKTPGEEDEQNEDIAKKTNTNPYIYKNHSGKLVCKLCNTMHMSWSSVERHLQGKKHGLNVLRRSKLDSKYGKHGSQGKQETEKTQFDLDVQKERENIQDNGAIPPCQVVRIMDEKSDLEGVCIRVDYSGDNTITKEVDAENPILYSPFARIVSGLELTSKEENDKKYIVVAYPPFSNVSIEIPNREILFRADNYVGYSVDEFNNKSTYWDKELGFFFVQFFFKNEENKEGISSEN